jgi:hypothetical protein
MARADLSCCLAPIADVPAFRIAMRSRRLFAAAVVLAALSGYYVAAEHLPGVPLWTDAVLASALIIPAVFAVTYLALPVRTWRGLLPVAGALVALAVAWDLAGWEIPSNFAKFAALTAFGLWFLGFFERLSWVVLVAAIIPLVDSLSVWRGPTNEIVTERPEVFDVLSVAFPAPEAGSFNLGLPDVLFFAVFLAAADRWHLRVRLTWLAMTASFGATLAIALAWDPFDLGGLPALPLLSIAFLAANADLLWRELQRR